MAEIPEAEFRRWYPVPVAIELLRRYGFDADEARESILHGLRTNAIDSAAERTLKLSRVPHKKNEDLPFAPMRSKHWLVDTPADSFWEDGNAALQKEGVPDFLYHHAGIRFRPADIDKLAAQRAARSGDARASGSMAVLTEGEFWSWLPPGIALQRLIDGGLPQNIAMPAIMNRISKGEIRIAARRYETRVGLLPSDTQFEIIPPKDFAPSSNDAVFWELGDVKYSIRRKNRMMDDTYICTGIRLDPAGISEIERQRAPPAQNALAMSPGSEPMLQELRRMVAQTRLDTALAGGNAAAGPFIDPFIAGAPGLTIGEAARYFAGSPALPTPRGRRANPVTDREIKVWHRGLTKTQKSLGVLALWDLARAAHPDRHLPRKLVEQFGIGRSNGHRPKT